MSLTLKKETTKTMAKAKKAAVKKNPKVKKIRKERVTKTRNGNTWTEAQYFQKIRSSLRSSFRFWVPMMQCLKAASRPSQSSNKRLKTEYKCAECSGWFPRTSVEIDHIFPCGELRNYDDIVPFIKNLTQENKGSYQVLCKICHKEKTTKENTERKTKKRV